MAFSVTVTETLGAKCPPSCGSLRSLFRGTALQFLRRWRRVALPGARLRANREGDDGVRHHRNLALLNEHLQHVPEFRLARDPVSEAAIGAELGAQFAPADNRTSPKALADELGEAEGIGRVETVAESNSVHYAVPNFDFATITQISECATHPLRAPSIRRHVAGRPRHRGQVASVDDSGA